MAQRITKEEEEMLYRWAPDLPVFLPLLVGCPTTRAEMDRILARQEEEMQRERQAREAWKPILDILAGNWGLTESNYRALKRLITNPYLNLEIIKKNTYWRSYVFALEIQMQDAAIKYGY